MERRMAMRVFASRVLAMVGIGLMVATRCAPGLEAEPGPTEAAGKPITLMLGGKFCEFYPKELTEALMKVKGVKGVDLKSMKGHAVVEHDDSVKPEALVAAMKNVKGTKMGMEWYCTAEAMK
jgi:copper chaperone CopZ